MPGVLIEVVRAILGLLDKAMAGDDEAMRKISSILEDDLATELASKRQDLLDVAKYGPRR